MKLFSYQSEWRAVYTSCPWLVLNNSYVVATMLVHNSFVFKVFRSVHPFSPGFLLHHKVTIVTVLSVKVHVSCSTFSRAHKVGNIGINANFLFPYICGFLHYLYLKILVNVKLDVSW